MATRNADLEMENKSLKAMQTEVIRYNRAFHTFEFTGSPQPLNYGQRIKKPADVLDVVAAVRAWLEANPRITFKEIFRSLDKGNFGDLKESDFLQAFQRIGVELTPDEVKLLKQKLDLKANNLFEIAPLLRVLSGIPTKQFLPLGLINMANFVITQDWSVEETLKNIDPRSRGTQDIDDFKRIVGKVTSS
jgi:Ca2+-binding EF-hand superfamily protein